MKYSGEKRMLRKSTKIMSKMLLKMEKEKENRQKVDTKDLNQCPRIRIRRICTFLCIPDANPDPFVRIRIRNIYQQAKKLWKTLNSTVL
jgi:hypothetical protein